jgi:hypothetical protein
MLELQEAVAAATDLARARRVGAERADRLDAFQGVPAIPSRISSRSS